MATGSYMTPIYSRSQSEVLGDLHRVFRQTPVKGLPFTGKRFEERARHRNSRNTMKDMRSCVVLLEGGASETSKFRNHLQS
ncbi:hypothetical protein TNCV_3901131 [Trichonephila clavipes]|nr:hypothetical protein TNCV_3901131 [Trichonephila clavipes]